MEILTAVTIVTQRCGEIDGIIWCSCLPVAVSCFCLRVTVAQQQFIFNVGRQSHFCPCMALVAAQQTF